MIPYDSFAVFPTIPLCALELKAAGPATEALKYEGFNCIAVYHHSK